MLTLKTSRQLRSKRNLKSFRACPASTGLSSWRAEMRRLSLEDVAWPTTSCAASSWRSYGTLTPGDAG